MAADPSRLVASDMLTRTFFIRFGNSRGTGFTVDIDGRQYVVTAAHVLSEFPKKPDFAIQHNGTWHPLSAKLVGIASPDADVAVVALERSLTVPTSVHLTTAGVIVSDDVFFLGFPFGISTASISLNAGYPLALIKKATISGIITKPKSNEYVGYFLDAINNPGFSGGPVISGGSPPRVIAVISGYTAVNEPVRDASGAATKQYVPQNSGIVQSYKIEFATKLIADNPIGFKELRTP